jgi:NADH-quinone oxidoreductase subunit G
VNAARALIAGARKAVAIVSSWGSNEELAAFQQHLAARFRCFVKQDRQPEPGERLEDELLIKPDKNPNGASARALFGAAPIAFDADTDLVLVWGEGFDFATLPRGARVILLNAWLQPENGHADVFLPLSIQTERNGHYSNFAGVTSEFRACFPRPAGAVDAASLFARLTAHGEAAP